MHTLKTHFVNIQDLSKKLDVFQTKLLSESSSSIDSGVSAKPSKLLDFNGSTQFTFDSIQKQNYENIIPRANDILRHQVRYTLKKLLKLVDDHVEKVIYQKSNQTHTPKKFFDLALTYLKVDGIVLNELSTKTGFGSKCDTDLSHWPLIKTKKFECMAFLRLFQKLKNVNETIFLQCVKEHSDYFQDIKQLTTGAADLVRKHTIQYANSINGKLMAYHIRSDVLSKLSVKKSFDINELKQTDFKSQVDEKVKESKSNSKLQNEYAYSKSLVQYQFEAITYCKEKTDSFQASIYGLEEELSKQIHVVADQYTTKVKALVWAWKKVSKELTSSIQFYYTELLQWGPHCHAVTSKVFEEHVRNLNQCQKKMVCQHPISF